MSAFFRPGVEHPLLEAVDDDLRLRAVAEPLADRGDQLLGLAQARHRHFADDEQPVGAEQHAVGPGEPGARHVDHDIVEVRRHEIEQPRHHVGIEGAHLGRPVRRRDHRKAGRMMRQHDFEKLPVEPLRPRLDLLEIQPRLEIEIVGAGAVLEIEIDQAGGGAAALAAVEQQQRGLDRQRGDAGAADRGQEGVDLRLGGLGRRRTARPARRCAPARPAAPA